MKISIVNIKEQKGFTLAEILIAIAILAVAIIAIVQLFTVSGRQNAVAADLTILTTLAQGKMEELKNMKYKSLIANGDAGSVTTPETGYFDDPDTFYQRLWEIDVDAPVSNMTTITVKVISSRRLIGNLKECELVITRSR